MKGFSSFKTSGNLTSCYDVSCYTFSGKEKDQVTGYSVTSLRSVSSLRLGQVRTSSPFPRSLRQFGARYYNSDLSIWLSVDPLSDKYPNITPYAYCANNPVMFIDPDEKKDKPFNAKTDKSITPQPGTATPVYNYDRNGKRILASGWTSAYNCHSYAWHNSKGDPNPAPGDIPQINGVPIPKWDNNPADDILQQNAEQLKNDENNIVGDVVIYYTDTDENGQYDSGESISHSAVVKDVDSEGNTTEVIGKMGQGEISTNHHDAPYYYKTDDKGNNTSRAYFRLNQTLKEK